MLKNQFYEPNTFLFFFMLKTAFIEIRAASSLNAAKKFADIFHSVPFELLNCKGLSDEQLVLDNLFERAKKYDLESYLSQLFDIASDEYIKITNNESSFELHKPNRKP